MRALWIFMLLGLLVPKVSRADGDYESIFFSTPEKLSSAQVELLFEERKVNDEGIETLGAPKSQPRESQLTFLGRDRWEIRVFLKEGDRARSPTVTSVVLTDKGTLIALPNRVLETPEIRLDALVPGAVTCLKDPSVLSGPEIAALTPQERTAFIRSREDDSARFAAEVNAMLTDAFANRLFEEERKLGIAPSEPMARRMTVDEIVRRLVTIESLMQENP